MSTKRTKAESIRVGDTVLVGDVKRHVIATRLRGEDIELTSTVGTLMVPRSASLLVSRATIEVSPETEDSVPHLVHSSETVKAVSSAPAAVFLAPGC